MVLTATLSLAATVTGMLLPVHAPFGGLVIDTVGGVVSPLTTGAGGSVVVEIEVVGAPEGTVGLVESLKIVMGAETAWLPEVSTATAFTTYAAGVSGPVSQPTLPLQ